MLDISPFEKAQAPGHDTVTHCFVTLLMNYELYRRSSLGLALTDALDELVQNQQLTPNLGLKVMGQFDKVMTESLNNKVKVRANLKVFFRLLNF